MTSATGSSKIANPGSLGLFSFASTTLMLSLYNAGARHIVAPNAVVGMAIFCGGLAQFMAGMWEFPRGNTFGATTFTSFGAFWMSYATILIPSSGIIAAYGTDQAEFASAVGIFLTTWSIVTFLFAIATIRKNVSFIALFVSLAVTFALLAAGNFNNSTGTIKAGGILGVITACIAYYIGLSDLLAAEAYAVVQIPLGNMTKSKV
ncbi:Gpr1 family protein [Tricholoma matsutake]|nr:Gpr1 family protein [Tricholoma matsutake 945]